MLLRIAFVLSFLATAGVIAVFVFEVGPSDSTERMVRWIGMGALAYFLVQVFAFIVGSAKRSIAFGDLIFSLMPALGIIVAVFVAFDTSEWVFRFTQFQWDVAMFWGIACAADFVFALLGYLRIFELHTEITPRAR